MKLKQSRNGAGLRLPKCQIIRKLADYVNQAAEGINILIASLILLENELVAPAPAFT